MQHPSQSFRRIAPWHYAVLTAVAAVVLPEGPTALSETAAALADGHKTKPTAESAKTTAEKTTSERRGTGDRTVTAPGQEDNANSPGAQAGLARGEESPWPYVVQLQPEKPLAVEGQVLDCAAASLDDTVVAVVASDPPANAAMQYWLAFSLMPNVIGDIGRATTDDERVGIGVPVSDELAKQLQGAGKRSLEHLHRGAKLQYCDWGSNFDRTGRTS